MGFWARLKQAWIEGGKEADAEMARLRAEGYFEPMGAAASAEARHRLDIKAAADRAFADGVAFAKTRQAGSF